MRPRITRRLRRALGASTDTASLLTALGWGGGKPDSGLDVRREVLLKDARHEADLLRHPYLAPEHVLLAAARRAGDEIGYAHLRATIEEGLPPVGWRPRGIFSARRRLGMRATERAYRDALREEEQRGLPDAG
jgi:hypothetical protein